MMSFLIERAGTHIAPHCQTLIHYLPLLWQESEGHHLLRCAIVTTLANLVQVYVVNNVVESVTVIEVI